MHFTPHPPLTGRTAAMSAGRHRLTGLIAGIVAAIALAACGGSSDPAPAPGDGAAPPATYTVGVSVNAVGAGESFSFSLGTQQIAVTQAGTSVAFATGLATGTAYTVSATAGPRACTLSSNSSGTVGSANVAVTADCGQPPAVPVLSAIGGTVRGPVGAQLVLQVNGGDDLTVTVARTTGSTDHYDETAFSFATRLADGAAYVVAVKTAPAGQTCSVYKGAAGTLPVAATALRVGCEFTADRVSRSSDDAALGTYYDSSAPVVGGSDVPIGNTSDGYGEGRFTAFVSNAGGIAAATSAHRQVFWRDSLTGETRLVSATAAGAEGNGDSFAPAISADGLSVAFESYSSNLVANDTNAVRDVFVWSATNPTGGVTRVSVGTGGAEANAESFEPAISGDGKVVAFSSGASNLSAGVSGINTVNVYRRDLSASTNTLVSADATGTGVGGARPALSEDGNRLAFYSFAPNLVAGDANGLWDIFVFDATTGVRTRVSLPSGGGERNQGSESASRVVAPAISGDGRYVAFATTASNMVPGDTNGMQDVFVVDTQTGGVVRASVASSGAQGNADSPVGQGERVALSFDGSWVAFTTLSNTLGAGAGGSGVGNVVMHNRVTGETRTVTDQTSGSVGPVAMSRNATYVVFGASTTLDPRFAGSGLFARFTGVARAWWWVD